MGQRSELIKPINAQYDIAVKVALSKSLKFLVVDNQQTAENCTEFLKEKGLFKEVLVLSNVPDKKLNHSLTKDFKEAHLIYDVVEISRTHGQGLLERAVRYFLADKVVCKDFDMATKLQRSGISNIIT